MNAIEKIEAHNGDLRKQQQVGDNHIHHSKNPHILYHVAKYMIENSIPSKYNLESVMAASKKRMAAY